MDLIFQHNIYTQKPKFSFFFISIIYLQHNNKIVKNKYWRNVIYIYSKCYGVTEHIIIKYIFNITSSHCYQIKYNKYLPISRKLLKNNVKWNNKFLIILHHYIHFIKILHNKILFNICRKTILKWSFYHCWKIHFKS